MKYYEIIHGIPLLKLQTAHYTPGYGTFLYKHNLIKNWTIVSWLWNNYHRLVKDNKRKFSCAC